MDKLRLNVNLSGEHKEVEIFINERNLIDILHKVELPFAKKEGHPDIAGSYKGLIPEMVFLPSEMLLGEPIYGEKLNVLYCGLCGEPGCWPFKVKIRIKEDKIIWNEFEQPHRQEGSSSTSWNYNELGEFVFDKEQYMEELSKIKWDLKSDFNTRGTLYQDPEYGWAIYINWAYEYFSKVQEVQTLHINHEAYDCRIVDVTRIFWSAHPIESKRTIKIDEWESIHRVLYLPRQPNLLYKWVSQWIDMNSFLKRWESSKLFDPKINPQIQSIKGIADIFTLGVDLQIIKPGGEYRIHPRKETYRKYQSMKPF